MLLRRDFIAAAGAGIGAAWLAADPAQLRASMAHAARLANTDFEVFTPEQAADVEAIAAQIVPTDDLPGAREARVVHFADHSLATWGSDQRRPFLEGLTAFNALVAQTHGGIARFALLTEEQRLAFLQANPLNPFFQQMIFITLTGTFSHPSWGGNFEGAGWRILGFDDRGVWQPPFGWYDAQANGGPN